MGWLWPLSRIRTLSVPSPHVSPCEDAGLSPSHLPQHLWPHTQPHRDHFSRPGGLGAGRCLGTSTSCAKVTCCDQRERSRQPGRTRESLAPKFANGPLLIQHRPWPMSWPQRRRFQGETVRRGRNVLPASLGVTPRWGTILRWGETRTQDDGARRWKIVLAQAFLHGVSKTHSDTSFGTTRHLSIWRSVTWYDCPCVLASSSHTSPHFKGHGSKENSCFLIFFLTSTECLAI